MSTYTIKRLGDLSHSFMNSKVKLVLKIVNFVCISKLFIIKIQCFVS